MVQGVYESAGEMAPNMNYETAERIASDGRSETVAVVERLPPSLEVGVPSTSGLEVNYVINCLSYVVYLTVTVL